MNRYSSYIEYRQESKISFMVDDRTNSGHRHVSAFVLTGPSVAHMTRAIHDLPDLSAPDGVIKFPKRASEVVGNLRQ
jgi:hypothetical protein